MVPVDSALVAEAEALGLDVSKELEEELRRIVERHKAGREWREENREVIEVFRNIEEHGPFGEEWRSW